jgi:hypothetical protein
MGGAQLSPAQVKAVADYVWALNRWRSAPHPPMRFRFIAAGYLA